MIVEAPCLKVGTGKELRQLHDTVQQHLKALKAMGHEPSGAFVTSMIELKLDSDTMFEWQKHSLTTSDMPHYHDILSFIDLRARASETCSSERPGKKQFTKKYPPGGKSVVFFAAGDDSTTGNCVVCKTETHPLYMCSKFRALSHNEMLSTLRANNLCMNCLKAGHFLKQCKSSSRCRRCQKPHHTLLHIETSDESAPSQVLDPASNSETVLVQSHAATSIKSSLLLMTCRVLVDAPDGTFVEARALLDSASSASFISERKGITGFSHKSSLQSVAISHPPKLQGRNLG
jgi:hypothetical protein